MWRRSRGVSIDNAGYVHVDRDRRLLDGGDEQFDVHDHVPDPPRSSRSRPSRAARRVAPPFTTQPVRDRSRTRAGTRRRLTRASVTLAITTPAGANAVLHDATRRRRSRVSRRSPVARSTCAGTLHADGNGRLADHAVSSSSLTITVGAAGEARVHDPARRTRPAVRRSRPSRSSRSRTPAATRSRPNTRTVTLAITTPGGATLTCTHESARGGRRGGDVRRVCDRQGRHVHADRDRRRTDLRA